MMTHRRGIWREPGVGYLRLWSQVLLYLWAVFAVSPEVRGKGDITYQLHRKKIVSLVKPCTALVSPGGKLTLAHGNANLETTRTARRNVNCRSCWHSVCNHLLLHNAFSLVSKLTQKCTLSFHPAPSSSSPWTALQAFDLYQYRCVGSLQTPCLKEPRLKIKSSETKEEVVVTKGMAKRQGRAGQGLSWPTLFYYWRNIV